MLETVKKLRWCPDVSSLSHGWMATFQLTFPSISKSYKANLQFLWASGLLICRDDCIQRYVQPQFAKRLMLKGINNKGLNTLKRSVNYATLTCSGCWLLRQVVRITNINRRVMNMSCQSVSGHDYQLKHLRALLRQLLRSGVGKLNKNIETKATTILAKWPVGATAFAHDFLRVMIIRRYSD